MTRIKHALLLVPLAFPLALHSAGNITTWGSAAKVMPDDEMCTQISVGISHTLVLSQSGHVFAHGYNFDGQCNVPTGLASVKGVSAGQFFSLAVRSNGTVVAWGDNMHGQCDVPAGLSNAKEVSAGNGHAMALRNDGSIVAWGNNDYGQTNVPAGLGPALAVRAAGNYSLALRSAGTVAAWGDNAHGQTAVPQNLTGVTAIDGNLTFCLARKSDGTVVMWGRGPQVPQGLTQVVGIAAGESHALALKSDGSIVAWGGNEGGQLQIPASLGAARSVAAAWNQSAAITSGAAAVFAAFNPRWQTGQFSVSVPTEQGFSYRLEYKDSLSAASWTVLPAVPGTGAAVTLTDSNASAPRRSYRIVRF